MRHAAIRSTFFEAAVEWDGDAAVGLHVDGGDGAVVGIW